MTKPRGIRWLEEQTGEILPPTTEVHEGRHLSVRLSGEILARLGQLAAERGETVSQVTRRLIAEGLNRRAVPDREALDVAIAALERLRTDLNPPAA